MEMNLPNSTPEAARVYRERCDHFARQRDECTQRWERIANVRLLVFVAAMALLIWGVWQQVAVIGIVGVGLLAIFFALVAYHRKLGRLRQRYVLLWQINDEAAKRQARDWDALPLRHQYTPEPSHSYAVDLDIFGHASLFQLADTASTHMGEATLTRWLLAPAPPDVVRERQTAVAELAPAIDLRDELALRGRLMGEARPDPTLFLEWAESERWLARRPWLRWYSIASVAVLWVLLLAQLFGFINYPAWFLLAAANFAVAMTVGRAVYDILSQISAGERGFHHYADAFELLEHAPFSAPCLKAIQSRLGASGAGAQHYMRRLHRLTSYTLPVTSMLYTVIQALTMWDVHLLTAFERWQAEAGARARDWLAALGEVEALSALAALKHANPEWAFPEVDSDADRLHATSLGHPLIPPGERVDNDVEVGPPGTFLLVTGSNMSGKSTLLRAIGVNIVLAQAGGPVCASSMRLPPVDLWTSMRIQDSLERGVSYFMAELQRLKQIVDAAHQDRAPGSPRLFYLLDEILHGTNTYERQIAARRVVMHLVRQGAIGAVSTHDLTLVEEGEIADAARLVHFTETFTDGPGGAPQMRFDYKLRPGLATSRNALRLMEMVGLDLEGVQPGS